MKTSVLFSLPATLNRIKSRSWTKLALCSYDSRGGMIITRTHLTVTLWYIACPVLSSILGSADRSIYWAWLILSVCYIDVVLLHVDQLRVWVFTSGKYGVFDLLFSNLFNGIIAMQCYRVHWGIEGCALWVCKNVKGDSRVVSKGTVLICAGKINTCSQERRCISSAILCPCYWYSVTHVWSALLPSSVAGIPSSIESSATTLSEPQTSNSKSSLWSSGIWTGYFPRVLQSVTTTATFCVRTLEHSEVYSFCVPAWWDFSLDIVSLNIKFEVVCLRVRLSALVLHAGAALRVAVGAGKQCEGPQHACLWMRHADTMWVWWDCGRLDGATPECVAGACPLQLYTDPSNAACWCRLMPHSS
jgi:hypothetical protein